MKKNPHLPVALLVLVLALGTLIRVWHFPLIPPGLNQDEAASAYESFSLAKTGMDKWGNSWPVYFPAWGSGQNVLLAYLTLPFVKLFGLNIFTARIASLVLGLLTLPLFHYCLRPLGRFPALFGTFLLAVVPWHFILSRWGLESNLVPFFMLLGCTTLSRALITQQRRWIIPSLIPFALSLYAYGTTIVVLPFLLGAILLLGFHRIRVRSGSWLLAAGLFLAIAAPFLLFFVENYLLGYNLAWTDSFFFSTPVLPSTRMSQVAASQWTHTLWLNCRLVLSNFNDGTEYNRIPGFKPLLLPTLPLAIMGLLLAARRFRQRQAQLFATPRTTVLTVFAVWALAACSLFLAFELNINRFNHFYLPCLVLAVWAIEESSTYLKSGWPSHTLRIALVSWVLLESSLSVNQYFTIYLDGPIRTDFNEGLADAFQAVNSLPDIDQLRITAHMPLPYVYTLFYSKYPPAKFQREVQFRIKAGVYEVERFGKYVFVSQELQPTRKYGYLVRKGELSDTAASKRTVVFTNNDWEVGVVEPLSN